MREIWKILFILLGTFFVILGLIGIFVPILPTTVFLLLAAYFYARSSDRALQWLLHNRWFGSYIRNYKEGRGMAVKNKVITLVTLWLTIGFTAIFVVENTWVRLLLAAVAVGVTTHILWIKTYRPEHDPHSGDHVVETNRS